MKSISEDIADGLKYGFPECCILRFVLDGGTAGGRQQARERGIAGGENPYVVCGILHHPDPLTLHTEHWDTTQACYVDD